MLFIKNALNSSINIFWFRRDLRLSDNTGLFHALKSGLAVLPVFIFDEHIISNLNEKTDKRLSFILFYLKKIQTELEKHGSSLLVLRGTPENAFIKLIQRFPVTAVYTNRDYEPYAVDRDHKIRQLLHSYHIGFHDFKDQVIFEKDEILKPDGKPYTVFTPYSKKWKEKLKTGTIPYFPSEKLMDHFLKTQPFEFPELNCPMVTDENEWAYNLSAALLTNYEKERNFPVKNGTSGVSIHLRFGTLSVRKLVETALIYSESWLNELIWREFFMQILAHFPHVVSQSFRPAYDQISWLNNEKDFERWCRGETGYPIVDAGMRQLNETGTMHNRVRMITASFLVKHLLIDWRWGESYFASKLMDFELSSNNGNWQWAAGSGCDSAPYFRIFNPITQAEKFDPDKLYIKRWVPEWSGNKYIKPIIDHNFARERCIKTFNAALKNR